MMALMSSSRPVARDLPSSATPRSLSVAWPRRLETCSRTWLTSLSVVLPLLPLPPLLPPPPRLPLPPLLATKPPPLLVPVDGLLAPADGLSTAAPPMI